MFFSNEKDNNLLYEIDINIKAYTKITKKDKERINKIALLIDSLGYDEDTTEKLYRFTSEKENGELLLDVQDCTKQKQDSK
ncbi:MAG TPA: hypothetical protein PLT51_02920 [Candidatus Dojkabacteria bacterium]|nr:hypothetical protein [Methanofastidiosum sp.]HPP18908.1 hypothetical protein [Candidatus Dojkabacteria bacterium]